MRENPRIQCRFSVVNKMCQQCVKECKKFANVTVLQCNFVSNNVEGGTLPLATTRVCRGKDGGVGAVSGKQ